MSPSPVLQEARGPRRPGSGVPAAQAEAVKLKAASFLPERAIFAKHFCEWAAKVYEWCAGEVEVSVARVPGRLSLVAVAGGTIFSAPAGRAGVSRLR